MPTKPRHPCAYPGCAELISSGQYCEQHAKLMAMHYERYERSPQTKARYGRKWEKVRASYLSAHPLCEHCLTEGRMTPASLVHHKLPLSEGGTNDMDNLMALCAACHSRLHARDGSRWGNIPCPISNKNGK